MDDEKRIKQLNAVGDSLKELRRPYEPHFADLGDNFMPRRSRFSKGKDGRPANAVNSRILNGKPRLALRTLQGGMHAGITSPARPWFRLIPKDDGLRDYAPVKEHLSAAQREMRQLLQSSGLYTMLHTMWGDLGLFGYDVAIVEDHAMRGLHGQALVPGESWIGANASGMIDALYREYRATVKQQVAKFVYRNDPQNIPDWSKVDGAVKRAWDNGNHGERMPVRHLIMPRYARDPNRPTADNKPVMSVYWDERGNIMGDLGYDISPILASRWDAEGTDTYANSPAMDALGDAKELQRKERDKAEAIRRMNRPPMNAPNDMRNSPFSLMPEAVNFMTDPSNGMTPAIKVMPPISEMREDIRDSEDRIDEAMYANLFLMISNLDRRQITAREVDERHEEKLLGLGPVLERQHQEKLSVIIRRTYNKVVDSGRVPPLPPELAEMGVEIDYISTLGQAMKAVATGGIERLYGFVGNVSAVDGSVLDNMNNDEATREYADMVGVPPNVVRPASEVEDLRKQRADQIKAQQAMDQAQQMAETAQSGANASKVLSEAGQPRGDRDILGELGLG